MDGLGRSTYRVDMERGERIYRRGDTNIGTEMKFVNTLLEEGLARGYISKAHAPTVTLPRIKVLKKKKKKKRRIYRRKGKKTTKKTNKNYSYTLIRH